MYFTWPCPECGEHFDNVIRRDEHIRQGHEWWETEAYGYGFTR